MDITKYIFGQTPYGAVTGRAFRDDARRGELGVLSRPDGGHSTEISTTLSDPRLMGGAAVNIPLLVQGQTGLQGLLSGQEPSEEQINLAIMRALQRVRLGAMLPSFGSIDEAVGEAQNRPTAAKRPYYR